MTISRSHTKTGRGGAAARAAANDGPWLAGVVLCAFAVFISFSINSYPFGIAVVGAERILSGEVPYRDFWTMYAPGQYYLLAFLFAVFGNDNVVSPIAGALLCAAAVGLTFRLMSRITGRRGHALACAAVAVAAFVASGYHDSVNSYPPAVFCILVALNFLEAYLGGGRKRFLIGAGLATGSVALFKHDVGAYTAVAVFSGVVVHHLVAGGPARLGTIARDLFSFALAAAAPVLPVVAALALVAGPEAWQSTIVFPATDFKHVRAEGYPNLLPVGLYDPWKLVLLFNWGRYAYYVLPLLIWLAGLPAIVLALRRRQAALAGLGATFAVAFVLHFLAAQVQVNTHIISMTIYAVCLGALALHCLASRRREGPAPWLRGLAAIVVIGWFGAAVAQPAYALLQRQSLDTAFLSLPKVSWVRLQHARAAQYTALVEFVQRHVPPGQPIYVGNHRHDVVVVGRTMLYFILDRPPATRHHEMHPGITDTGPVQAEIIADLKRKQVQLIVLARFFDDDDLDYKKKVKRRKMPAIGATALDEFIRANYEPAAQFGEYAVWLAKPQ